jgi:hypothetical protein
MLLQNHYQNAYVTRDLDRALVLFRTEFGIEDFKQIEASVEVRTPAGRGTATLRLALGWTGSLQYELIQPLSGLVDVYKEALPDQELLRFHHVCMRVHDDWPRFRAELDRQKRPVVLEGGSEGHLQFVYVDARDSLGHFLEYCWMTPQRWTAMDGR